MKITESNLKLLIKSIITETMANEHALEPSKLKNMTPQQKKVVDFLVKRSFAVKNIYDIPEGGVGVTLERAYGKGSNGRVMGGPKIADVKPDGTINSQGVDVDTYIGRVGEKIEPVIQKTPNQNHEFDAGRTSVMKAVNVAEIALAAPSNTEGSTNIQRRTIEGIAKKGFKFLGMKAHGQIQLAELSNGKLTVFVFPDGSIKENNPAAVKEKVGSDGRYQDDMESGVAVKKLHQLKEQGIVRPYRFLYVGVGSGNVYGVSSAPTIEKAWEEFQKLTVRTGEDASDAAYDKATVKRKDNGFWVIQHKQSTEGMFLLLDIHSQNPDVQREITQFGLIKYADEYLRDQRQSTNPLEEESGTGAVGGYSTPFAFSRNKLGSGRAIAAAKKYGKVVKSISEKGQK